MPFNINLNNFMVIKNWLLITYSMDRLMRINLDKFRDSREKMGDLLLKISKINMGQGLAILVDKKKK
jgi:hypothetical protein